MNEMLTPILKLNLSGLAPLFEIIHLQERALSLMNDMRTLFDTNSLLECTTMVHKFMQVIDDRERPAMQLVIGLALNNQMTLEFHHHSVSPADLELRVLEDRERLVKACMNLQIQTTLAATELSNRVAAGCMDIPDEDVSLQFSKYLSALLNTRNRSWQGNVNERPWQHQLPSMPVYQWHRGTFDVRVVLHRERRGFSLELLRRPTLPEVLQGVRRLPMPERPANIDLAATLDRAEYKRAPLEIKIRVGSLIGTEDICVADFVGIN